MNTQLLTEVLLLMYILIVNSKHLVVKKKLKLKSFENSKNENMEILTNHNAYKFSIRENSKHGLDQNLQRIRPSDLASSFHHKFSNCI